MQQMIPLNDTSTATVNSVNVDLRKTRFLSITSLTYSNRDDDTDGQSQQSANNDDNQFNNCQERDPTKEILKWHQLVSFP